MNKNDCFCSHHANLHARFSKQLKKHVDIRGLTWPILNSGWVHSPWFSPLAIPATQPKTFDIPILVSP